MDNHHLLNNHNDLVNAGCPSISSAPHTKTSMESLFVTDTRTTPTLITAPMNVKLATEALKMEPGLEAQLASLQTSACGPLTMASIPINALSTGEKLNLQASDLENIPILNAVDGRSIDLQHMPTANPTMPGVQMVKLTFINCGDQQTILFTTPSGPLNGLDPSGEGLTITIPENFLGGNDLNLAGLSSVPVTNIPQSNPTPMEAEVSSASDKVSYATITSLPPITSVSDKLYAQKVSSSAPTLIDTNQSYGFQNLVPLLTCNGDKAKTIEKPAMTATNVFPAVTADFFQASNLPITLNLPTDTGTGPLVDFPTTELKIARPLSPGKHKPSTRRGWYMISMNIVLEVDGKVG